jgi:hypothetical protein
MLRGGRRRLEGESVLAWGLFEEKRVRKSGGLACDSGLHGCNRGVWERMGDWWRFMLEVADSLVLDGLFVQSP